MPEKISIVKDTGETVNSNIVSLFMIPDTGKKYIITTENAVDPHGLTVLHVSEIVDGNLQKIATDEEWSSIKTIMRAIISGNVVSYKYLPPIESANASSQYSRDISVSASASKQMVDNYNSADKNSEEDTNVAANPVGDGTVPTPENNGDMSTSVPPMDNNYQQMPVDPNMNPTTPIDIPINEQTPMASMPSEINSIFPSGSTNQTIDEVVPGISEVSNVAPPVEATAPIGQMDMMNQNIVSPIPNNNMTVPPQNGMPINIPVDIQPINPQGNDFNAMNNMNMGYNEMPPFDPNQMMNNQYIPNQPMNQMPMNQQVAPLINNINANFNPNATLDEVIVAAQEMFMAGVKNLVDTINEKLYRDFYAKESELKAREEAVAQKEQLLASNQNMMNYNNMGMAMMPNNMMPNMNIPNQPMNQMNQMMPMNQPMYNNMNQPPMNQNMNMGMDQDFNQSIPPMPVVMPPLPISDVVGQSSNEPM